MKLILAKNEFLEEIETWAKRHNKTTIGLELSDTIFWVVPVVEKIESAAKAENIYRWAKEYEGRTMQAVMSKVYHPITGDKEAGWIIGAPLERFREITNEKIDQIPFKLTDEYFRKATPLDFIKNRIIEYKANAKHQ